MENNEIYGKWMMIISGDTYTVPAGYIEEITNNKLIVYSFDKKHLEFSLKINFVHQQFVIGNNDAIDYGITKDKILEKFYKNGENEITKTRFVKLVPTTIHYPLKNVRKNQYKLLSGKGSAKDRDQILDFSNSNVRRSVDLSIENIFGTHFIVGYYRKKKAWFFPIKEIHKDHLLIYGLSADSSASILSKQITKKPVPPKEKLDIFLESKLNLLIKEFKKQKERLEQEIDDAKNDLDYMAVHYLMNNYQNVNRKFNTFSTIKNKNHLSIVSVEYTLERYEERLKKETEEYQIKLLKENIEEYKEKIVRLKNEKNKLRPQATELQKAMEQICDGVKKRIRLQLKEKHQVFLDIKTHYDQLAIVIDCNGKEGHLDCDFNVLRSLGFEQKGNTYHFLMYNFTKDNIDNVITLLSRVTFEAFYHSSLDNPMKLKLI